MNIQEIRQKYPQYDNLSDAQLAKSLHAKYYSDMDYSEFSKRVGLSETEQNTGPNPEEQEAVRKALFPSLKERFTGETMMTERLRGIEEIGKAPELSELSGAALKASFGLMSSGEPRELMSILKAQYGDRVSFDQDEKGNVIVKFPSGEYALNMPGFSAQDVAQGALDIAAFLPAGRGTVPLVAAKTAGIEAALEAGESAIGGEFDTADVLTAGALGGSFKALEDTLSLAYRAIKGKAPQSQQDLIDFAKDEGIPLTTSDVMPPETFSGRMAQETAEKVPFVGTGGIRETQQKLREQAVDRVSQKYGEFSERAIIDSLKAKKDYVRQSAGNTLSKLGSKLDEAGEIPLTNTISSIESVESVLSRPGILRSSRALEDLKELSTKIKEAPQTYSTLKENRSAFRQILDAIDPSTRKQLTSRDKALLQKVYKAMKKDMDNLAKEKLTPRELSQINKANAVWFREFQDLTRTKLKNLLDKGDVVPEEVNSMLFSRKGSEVSSLYKSLTQEGRENARAAIINRVIDNVSRRASGLTPDSFMNELKKYPAQTMAFFKGKDRKQLQGLIKVLEATQRAQKAAVTTPTGQATIGAGTGISAFIAPVETIGSLGTVGGLARLYESRPVRDALLRLSSVPKGSTQFEKAVSDAVVAINSAAQTIREQSEDRQLPQ